MKNTLRKFIRTIFPSFKFRKLSFAQYGEDRLIYGIFNEYFHITRPGYLDIGAHHPFHLNNTALLYKMGSRGINIEANPALLKIFDTYRPEDLNLNIGVTGSGNEMLPFYVMEQPELNTFVKETAEGLHKKGFPIKEVINIQCHDLNYIVKTHCGGIFPDFLSIDAEGMDEAILGAYDFSKTKPKVVCVENLSRDDNGTYYKREEIRNILITNGYTLIADTFLNDIFADNAYIDFKKQVADRK